MEEPHHNVLPSSRLSIFVHPSTLKTVSDDNLLQLRLLKDRSSPHQMPRWMKHYHVFAYVIYSLISLYSWFYLTFVGVYQAHPRMQIQYIGIVRFLEFNSYSILSPLLCSVFMGILVHHVRKRTTLQEGDFFGLLGILLFLAMINFHDGWGMLNQIKRERDYNTNTVHTIDPPPQDNSSTKELHWQYSWSTKPSCAKKYVRNLVYQHEYDKKHVKRQVLLEFGAAQQRGHQADVAADTTYALNCNRYHDNKTKAKTRKWMNDLHKEFKCCGPYGFKSWVKWFDSEAATGCNLNLKQNGEIPGCYSPLIQWLDKILLHTFWIMLAQGFLYITAMIVALAHHRAVMFEQNKVAKSYSLLNMTQTTIDIEDRWWEEYRPPHIPQVVGTNIVKETEAEDGREGGALPIKESTVAINSVKFKDTADNRSVRSKRKENKAGRNVKLVVQPSKATRKGKH